MIPLDWMLIVRGHDDRADIGRPGASAPSISEVEELVRLYG